MAIDAAKDFLQLAAGIDGQLTEEVNALSCYFFELAEQVSEGCYFFHTILLCVIQRAS